MIVQRLEHFNIRTTKLAETIEFYARALGMEAKRAPMASSGPPTWLHDASGVAAVHITPVDPEDPEGSYAKISQYRGGEPDAAFAGSGAIDHIAFHCEDIGTCKSQLGAMEVPFAENAYPKLNLTQLYIKDPNGITVELNFWA